MDQTDLLEKTATGRFAGDRCQDFDEDCADVPCKLHCWLYQPDLGICPYLTGEIA